MVKENLKYYTFEKSINPGKNDTYSFTQNLETDDEAPFKNLEIINTGNSDIKVFINQGKHFRFIPSGVIFQLEGEKIESLRFENVDLVNKAEFIFTLDNKLTEKELLKQILGVKQ